MENKFTKAMSTDNVFGYTENHAIKRVTTGRAILDMFGLGAAYRSRSEADCVNLFMKAFNENETYAMKCLFYIRDILEGQGERRFFRVCMRYLAMHGNTAAQRNIRNIPIYGRYDDLIYIYEGTPFEKEAFTFIAEQLAKDVHSKTPSLLGKWMPSENTSSAATRKLATKLRTFLGLTPKQYRKTLSTLRERINVLERLMSAGKWDEIEFDKIPSKAGMIYRNAFARHDVERAKNKQVKTYEEFAKDTSTKVNAKALYPYECVGQARRIGRSTPLDDVNRLMVNKYWDNLTDYFNTDAKLDALAIVDTSGSMCRGTTDAPINVALSLGLYCAEHAHGPYHNKFMTFSSNPQFVRIEGVDFVDKIQRMSNADWGGSTNIEACFDMILTVAVNNHLKQEDIPQSLIVISDMEFDSCTSCGARNSSRWGGSQSIRNKETLFETMKKKWANYGYQMPHLVFWNVDARSDNFAMRDDGNVNYVSGMSPSIFKQVIEGKTAIQLMLDKLNSERYAAIK